MNPTEMYEVCSRLIDFGWKQWEAERLYDFLIRYKQTDLDLPELNFDIRKLEFLRYLKQTDRLSD